MQVWRPPRGCARRFTAGHLIDSLRAARTTSWQRRVRESARDWLRWWFPRTWKEVAAGTAERRDEDLPNGKTLERAVVQLDFAAMLWNRIASAASGPVARYLAFDASPQHGQEFFAQ